MTDILASYEHGLERLLQALGREHPRYVEALTLQSRLHENITATRRYGDTRPRRSERAQVIESINRLVIDTTDARLDEWCRPQQAENLAPPRGVESYQRPTSVRTSEVRKLLVEAFDDEELTEFCFDFSRPVYQEFLDRHEQITEDSATS